RVREGPGEAGERRPVDSEPPGLEAAAVEAACRVHGTRRADEHLLGLAAAVGARPPYRVLVDDGDAPAGRARPPGDDAGSGPRPDDDQIMCGHAEHSPYHGPPGRSARRGASLRQVATGTPTMPTGFVRRHPQGGIIWL